MNTQEFIDNEIKYVVQDLENITKLVCEQSNEFDGEYLKRMKLIWNISIIKDKIYELEELINFKSNNK